MGEPTTPLPGAKAFAEDERSVLLGYLDYHRAVLARKAEGISEAQARHAACPPSTLTLMGIIRHMADVERFWFRRRLVGEPIDALFPFEPADADADHAGLGGPEAIEPEWILPDDTTMADALALWRGEIAAADANIARCSVDDYEQADIEGQPPSTLRRVLVHLIEEYARHCGHADLLRQAADGAVGD
jgi:uncharacterized damage-inducible protein DinB